MEKRLHDQLLADTECLRNLVSRSGTEDVAGWCAAFFLSWRPGEIWEQGLTSPARQIEFLLGLLAGTSEPQEPKPFGDAEWRQAVELLNRIANAYGYMFFPTTDEYPLLNSDAIDKIDVVMPTYLNYFLQGILASTEQLADRVARYVGPFDGHLVDTMGIGASDALKISKWIADDLQTAVNDQARTVRGLKEVYDELASMAAIRQWSWARFEKELRAKAESLGPVPLTSPFYIYRSRIEESFGMSLADRYWKRFSMARGSAPGLQYLTEANPADRRPLLEIKPGVAICPLANNLFTSVLVQCEEELRAGPHRDAYLQSRDQQLEHQICDALAAFFPEGATLLHQVYENPKGQFEHDVFLAWNRCAIVLEAKASPPVEPFRDPDKAFTRIHDAFASKKGIQGGYDQAHRLAARLRNHETVVIYDSNGKPLASINADDYDDVFEAVVTRDDYGPLAVDLSLLLKKDDAAPYPWSIGILDLETLLGAMAYIGKAPECFFDYLRQRQELHGRVIASDELEIAGAFLKHGGLEHCLSNPGCTIIFDPTSSTIFDEIYEAQKHGETFELEVTEPVITDVRKALQDEWSTSTAVAQPARVGPKVGRNQPCPCGSGKKYKKCCGRH